MMITDIAERLTKTLGLYQTPGKDVMQNFARRTREWQRKGHAARQAATMAANDIFPADFKHIRFTCESDAAMETLLADIESL